jgi:homopolymeric O-antigen transport system permease protein
MIADTIRHHALVFSFIRRSYQLRYRQSMAGIVWAIVPPLASLLVSTVVFHKALGVDTGDVPYPVFALAGLVPWSFFATSLSTGVPSVAASQPMISRLSFPRAVIPISMVGTALIDLGITFAVFAGFVVITRVGLPLSVIWIPALVALEIIFVLGVVLLGSAMNVFSRDVRLAIPLLVQLWLFLTPVMYPLSTVPDNLRWIYTLNPMTGLIESFRDVLIAGHAPDLSVLAPSIVGGALALVLGTWYFGATENRFADVI